MAQNVSGALIGQPMSNAQLIQLKNFIAADPVLSLNPDTPDGDILTANALNLNASPNFTVWKVQVSLDEIGEKFNASELGGLTATDTGQLQNYAIWSPGGVNPSLADRRAFFDDIFSGAGGAQTRANLAALWKRLSTKFEKIYATGTGSDASPAILVVQGPISASEVNTANNL